jgi:hypothetical protein
MSAAGWLALALTTSMVCITAIFVAAIIAAAIMDKRDRHD